MRTETLRIGGDAGYETAIRKAASVLSGGGLVVFPTETVYGLGANAALPAAIDRLREVKRRPADKPFTVHVGRPDDLERYVPSPSSQGRRLAKKGWPGPLTLIFAVANPADAPVMKDLPPGQDDSIYRDGTIGLRCPAGRPALDLLTRVEAPVVVASANPVGEPPATSAAQALGYLDGEVDLILDGGRALYAKPSTIVRVNEDGCEVVRVGVLDERLIRRLLAVNFLFVCSGNTCRSPMAEGLCCRALAERLGCPPEALDDRGYLVSSAGTHGMGGGPATPEAVKACASLGVDISGHRAAALTPEQIHAADYIFGMTERHVETVAQLLPSARAVVVRLDPDDDVEDPIGGDPGLYESMAKRLEALVRRHLEGIEL
jgi:protein-tyrosine phosphatase